MKTDPRKAGAGKLHDRHVDTATDFTIGDKPVHVWVGPLKYEIIYKDLVEDDAFGNTDHDDLIISLRICSYGQMRLTLLHEVMHAIARLSLGNSECPTCSHLETLGEEKWVTLMSPPLLDVLLRNPALVKFLLWGYKGADEPSE